MKSLEELAAIREKMKQKVAIREGADDAVRIVVGMATCGISAGARPVLAAFVEGINDAGLSDKVMVTQTGCMGYCYAEPTIEIKLPGQEPLVFGYVDKAKVEEIIDKYIRKGILVDGIIPVTYTTVKPE